MKPPAFEYKAPTTLEQALAELEAGDGGARPLGGGQSLVPLLNFRLGAPETLIDLGRIPELAEFAIDGGDVKAGAMVPTARLTRGDVAAAAPLLAAAARQVGHPQIRTRGTVGGSIAHADPAAELPAAALLLDASIELASKRGRRVVAASDFFHGLFETACEWDEIVTAVRFPALPAGTAWGFREFSRRPGDFALAGVGVTLTRAGDTVASVTVVAFGLGSTPLRSPVAEEALTGRVPTAAVVAEACSALAGALEPSDTLHGSGAYRAQVAGALLQRALGDALRGESASNGAGA